MLSLLEQPRQPVDREEVDDPPDMEQEKLIAAYHETIGMLPHHSS